MSKFTYTVNKDPEKMIADAKKLAAENGADFEGDASSGRFSASGVKGEYSISGNQVEVRILEKPFFVFDAMLDSKLQEFFT